MDWQEQELMFEQIKLFEEQTDIKLQIKNGRPYYKGELYGIFSDYLPDNLVVDGSLDCFFTSNKLPNGLKVNGKLIICETNITEIPDDCEFKSLNISRTDIAKLRDNLMLDELKMRRTSLTELPRGLKVKGLLNISDTKITEIPDDCEFGSLDISWTKITKLRDNLTLDKLNVNLSDLIKLPRGLKVNGLLDISETKITEIPNDCEFGSLKACFTKITKLRDNLELDALIAYQSSLSELPKGLKVKGVLNISHTKITEIPDDCEFGGLFMNGTKITKLRDNLTLGGLIIEKSSITELPKNLVVYVVLNIKNTSIKCLPKDCLATIVFCDFELKDERYNKNNKGYYKLKDEIVHIIHLSGREFLHVDGILSEVIEKKGNVYHVRNGVDEPITYVVTDNNNHWAHGDTLEEAKKDLRYKMSVRDKSEYEKLTLDSELTFDEAVACYRVITGACRAGTQDYLEHRLPEPVKEKYTIREIIDLTKDEYGGDTFREFFEK